jgi:UDP-glucose 4-epimerase
MNELIFKVDHIYHLAAAVGVRNIMDHPVETLDCNVKGTEVVLRLSNRFKKKVFIASTSEVYGNHLEHTLSEDNNRVMGSVKKRRWAYACSKTLDEFLALAFYDEKSCLWSSAACSIRWVPARSGSTEWCCPPLSRARCWENL